MKKGYRLKPNKHPRLKWVVRAKIGGKWVRKYFEKKGEAETYCEQKNVELLNKGKESVEFPSWLRVMAQEADEQLQPYKKTIADAVSFYLAHIRAAERAIPLRKAISELVENRRGSGTSKRYCHDLELRLGRFLKDFLDRNTASFTTKGARKNNLSKLRWQRCPIWATVEDGECGPSGANSKEVRLFV